MYRLFQKIVGLFKLTPGLHVGFDSGGQNKPVIIMLHGIGATYHTWDGLIKELSADRYRIIALDLLGFGDSPMPADCEYTVEDHAKYVRRTIKKLKVKKPFILVGHSMGSIISAHYCRVYPNDVRRAYLLSLPIYSKVEKNLKVSNVLNDVYIKAYNLISQKKDFAIKYSKHLRNLLRIEDGLNVDEKTWHSFSLSLQNTIIRQHVYFDIKNTDTPIHIIFGSLDEFLVNENVNKLGIFKHVKITKLPAVNHTINSRFAKSVATIINDDNDLRGAGNDQ